MDRNVALSLVGNKEKTKVWGRNRIHRASIFRHRTRPIGKCDITGCYSTLTLIGCGWLHNMHYCTRGYTYMHALFFIELQ